MPSLFFIRDSPTIHVPPLPFHSRIIPIYQSIMGYRCDNCGDTDVNRPIKAIIYLFTVYKLPIRRGMLMSYINKLVVIALFGLFAFCLTAEAQSVPLLAGAPVGLGLVPYGNTGNGITDAVTWTTGAGTAATTDSFVNNFLGPSAVQGFGGCGFPGFGGWGCGLGACGIPSAFGSWGPFQTGIGGNFGQQCSQATGFSEASSFGLQPIGVVFGVPVAGPGGLLFT
jgi:hypothetical protein